MGCGWKNRSIVDISRTTGPIDLEQTRLGKFNLIESLYSYSLLLVKLHCLPVVCSYLPHRFMRAVSIISPELFCRFFFSRRKKKTLPAMSHRANHIASHFHSWNINRERISSHLISLELLTNYTTSHPRFAFDNHGVLFTTTGTCSIGVCSWEG